MFGFVTTLIVLALILLMRAFFSGLGDRFSRNPAGPSQSDIDALSFDSRVFHASANGMRTRLRMETVNEASGRYKILRIEGKGPFPVKGEMTLAFMASILDSTEIGPDKQPKLQPVVSQIVGYREPNSTCYRDSTDVGATDPTYGWRNWKNFLNVIPDSLVPPRRGRRTLRLVVLAIDVANPPKVSNGFLLEGEPLAVWAHEFEWSFHVEGYLDRSEGTETAEEGIIRFATAAAFLGDGDRVPGMDLVRRWAESRLEEESAEDAKGHRERLLNAVANALRDAEAGTLDLDSAVTQLNASAPPAARAVAIGLALHAVAACGVAIDRALGRLRDAATRLGVEAEQFETLKDKQVARIVSNIGEATDVHAILGIGPDWDIDRIRSHLNGLYAQWNSRAESLQDPERRSHAEQMLEVIARARQELLP